MVRGYTDLGGTVLRTLYTLRTPLARYAWAHGARLCEGYTSELASRHYNFWQTPWSQREGQPGPLLADGRRAASYPTILFACERYLFILESRYPEAFEAESALSFALGLKHWGDGLVETFAATWPEQGRTGAENSAAELGSD